MGWGDTPVTQSEARRRRTGFGADASALSFQPQQNVGATKMASKAHITIIGQGEARETMTNIAQRMRDRGAVEVNCYSEEGINNLLVNGHPRTDFVLLALSRAVREIRSPEHKREKAFFEQITRSMNDVPCGLIVDIDGYVSAPYLTEKGHLFTLIFARDHKEVPEIFKSYTFIRIENAVRDVSRIADTVSNFARNHPAAVK